MPLGAGRRSSSPLFTCLEFLVWMISYIVTLFIRLIKLCHLHLTRVAVNEQSRLGADRWGLGRKAQSAEHSVFPV